MWFYEGTPFPLKHIFQIILSLRINLIANVHKFFVQNGTRPI